MKIFWTASYQGKNAYQKYYDMVGRAIESQPDVEVIATEKGNYLSILPPTVSKSMANHPQKLHYEAIRRGIVWADAVVIEISHESFQLGHEATLAIQSKKHVLCVSVNEDYSAKVDNHYFHGAKYNRANIDEIIGNFFTLARKELLSRRFNLFLTSAQEQFVKTKGAESGLGASEYLRSLIDDSRSQT